MRRALITGVSGQDGSYLAELLLSKGYEVHGTVRPGKFPDSQNKVAWPEFVPRGVHLHAATLESYANIREIVCAVKPSELYHLAGERYAGYSFADERSTFEVNIGGLHHVLSAMRECVPECRLFFAASSEMFGAAPDAPQSETTPFRPRSVYGIAKCTGFELTRHYREMHGVFAGSGVLYNHESPRRPPQYVTRKITREVARIKLGIVSKLSLGNLEAKRDWGHARDFVRAMWLALQRECADDYVIATGHLHSVQEFAETAFRAAGLNYRDHVVADARLLRPDEPGRLVGDPTKALTTLGWTIDCSFDEMVQEMVDADLRRKD